MPVPLASSKGGDSRPSASPRRPRVPPPLRSGRTDFLSFNDGSRPANGRNWPSGQLPVHTGYRTCHLDVYCRGEVGFHDRLCRTR